LWQGVWLGWKLRTPSYRREERVVQPDTEGSEDPRLSVSFSESEA